MRASPLFCSALLYSLRRCVSSAAHCHRLCTIVASLSLSLSRTNRLATRGTLLPLLSSYEVPRDNLIAVLANEYDEQTCETALVSFFKCMQSALTADDDDATFRKAYFGAIKDFGFGACMESVSETMTEAEMEACLTLCIQTLHATCPLDDIVKECGEDWIAEASPGMQLYKYDFTKMSAHGLRGSS